MDCLETQKYLPNILRKNTFLACLWVQNVFYAWVSIRSRSFRLFRFKYQKQISSDTKVESGGAYPISTKSVGSILPHR